MRIIQVIDSLEVGGAETMAVNYANALSGKIEFSGLVATRSEGALKEKISKKVSYFFLGRKKTIDINAVLKLKSYCQKHKVNYVQAHSSSFFIAVLLKMIYPKIKIIWHDHNGLSEFVDSKKSLTIRMASFFFDKIIVVNDKLKNWAVQKLYCKQVMYLPNFIDEIISLEAETQLQGIKGKRILCLANLREQKNHFFLLQVAEKVKEISPDWTFHLVGKDFEDAYSKQIKEIIAAKKLSENVFIYGSRNDVAHIISQSDIAILTSQSEGLPLALLEYGLHKKPVVVTAVGEIPLIIRHAQNGYITPKDDINEFYCSLLNLIDDEKLRQKTGKALEQTVYENHSESAIIYKLLNWLK